MDPAHTAYVHTWWSWKQGRAHLREKTKDVSRSSLTECCVGGRENGWAITQGHPLRERGVFKYIARFLLDAFRARPMVSAQDLPTVERTAAEHFEVLRQANRSGVVLLAGTDIPAGRFPGFALHDELALLVEAGLTPLQAQRTATLNAARSIKRESEFVLLDANPLDDIHNTQPVRTYIA